MRRSLDCGVGQILPSLACRIELTNDKQVDFPGGTLLEDESDIISSYNMLISRMEDARNALLDLQVERV